MAKLPVVPDYEREAIRGQLQAYKDRHRIGVPRLQERMEYALDPVDKRYVDRRSLQRFLTGEGRTDDEKVLRYRKFLRIERDPNPLDAIVESLFKHNDEFLKPFGRTDADPWTGHRLAISAYEGRYAHTRRPYGTEHKTSNDNYHTCLYYVFLPSECGRYLKFYPVYSFNPLNDPSDGLESRLQSKDEADGLIKGLLMALSPYDFLMIDWTGTEFAMLRNISTAEGRPIILEGPQIVPIEDGTLSDDPVRMLRLERIAGPETEPPEEPEWIRNLPDLSEFLRDDPE